MNTQALSMARRLFQVDGVASHTQRHNIRGWVRSVRFLGDKWLIANPQEKK
jgi:hypothetical protein